MEMFTLLLGSNRGNRSDYLCQARNMIALQIGPLFSVSSVFESAPWGFSDPVKFLNQVVNVGTNQNPTVVLEHILNIERSLGRIREENTMCGTDGCQCESDSCKVPVYVDLVPDRQDSGRQAQQSYSSRTIDIDILFYGSRLVFTEDLMIPHPRLHLRKFTMVPLMEIMPEFVHPLLNKTVKALMEECPDTSMVTRYDPILPV